MELNKKKIKFHFSKEDRKKIKFEQKEYLTHIEEIYFLLNKRCLNQISVPVTGTHKEWIKSRVYLHSNASVMRLLYLTESFCDASKKFNSVSVASLLKSMAEIPLHLGFLLFIISENNDFEKIRDLLGKLAFGNRDEKTNLTSTSKISGKELYQKTDDVLKKMSNNESWNIFETIYKETNAFGHHNYEGRDMLCGLMDHKTGNWSVKDRKEIFQFYSNTIFQFFLYADAILTMSNIILNHIDNHLNSLPIYLNAKGINNKIKNK